MKKAFLLGFTGLFFAWTITYVTYSQGSIASVKVNPHLSIEKQVPMSKQLNSAKHPDFFLRNEINARAVRNFTRKYKNISDAKWFKSASGEFAVYFKSESIMNTIYYNKNGDFEFMIRHYSEEKLPREVRHLVRSKYYDFNIYYVTEITRNGRIVYGIKLEDKKSWKTITVADDEIEIIEEYYKP